MSMNPERDGAIAYQQESAAWAPLIAAAKERTAMYEAEAARVNAVRANTEHYETKLAAQRKRYERELDLLKETLRVREGRSNLELEKASLQVSEANESVRASRFDHDCLVVAINGVLDQKTASEVFRRKDEIASAHDDQSGGDKGFSMFD